MPENPNDKKNIERDLSADDKNKAPAPEGSGEETKDESANRKRKNFTELYGEDDSKKTQR